MVSPRNLTFQFLKQINYFSYHSSDTTFFSYLQSDDHLQDIVIPDIISCIIAVFFTGSRVDRGRTNLQLNLKAADFLWPLNTRSMLDLDRVEKNK